MIRLLELPYNVALKITKRYIYRPIAGGKIEVFAELQIHFDLQRYAP